MGKILKLKTVDPDTNRPTKEDLYPITSTKAVFDNNNTSLETILEDLSKLTSVITVTDSGKIFIKGAGGYDGTTIEGKKSLQDLLNAIK